MMRVNGIIFDKDGTLFDFSSTWEAWAKSFLTRVAKDEHHASTLGRAIGFDYAKESFEGDSIVIAGTPGEVAGALAPHLPQYALPELLFVLNDEASNAPQVEATPLKPFLETLRSRDLQLGVVTNDAEEPARSHLETAEVTGFFDFIAGFDSGYGAKPAPGQLLAFLKQTNLLPHEVIMVGDSTHDLIAARAAGMRGIGVLTGMAGERELLSFAEVILPDIGHLPAWVEEQNRGVD